MLKKVSSIIVIFLIMITCSVPVQAGNEVNISAKYAIVIDEESGRVLYEKNAREKMYPASITKILTIITALEMVDDLDQKVTITQSDIDTVWETGASAANFEVGEVVTYRDIFMGAMLPSGADACRALANNTCGNQEDFVKKMNELVKKLGLKDSHFVNTTGIHDDNHYTTVYDMAYITQYAMQNERFVELFNRYQYNSSNGLHQWIKKVIYNAKKAHIDTSMIKGCKSGYTSNAQHTLSSSLDINGHTYISVVGFCQNSGDYSSSSVKDTLALGHFISSQYQYVHLKDKGEKVKTLDVKGGKVDSLDVTLKQDINAVLPQNYDPDQIQYNYRFENIQAPVEKGDKVGTLKVTYQDDLLFEETFLAGRQIEKDIVKIMKDTFVRVIIPWTFGILFVFVVVLLTVRKIIITRRKKRRRRQKRRRRY